MMKESSPEIDGVVKGSSFGVRHLQVGMMFLLSTVVYGMRYNVSVAILAMTDNTTSSNPDIPTYDWDNKGVILSSFFWAYGLLQIVAAEVTRVYGTKQVLTGAMLINCLAFMMIPLVSTHFGSYGMIACRVVQGLFQGCIFPSLYNILGKWVPPLERSRMMALSLSGVPLGIIMTMPMTGYICSSSLGWPFSFYISGGFGLLWIVIWHIYGASCPDDYKTISDEERLYIQLSLGTGEQTQKQSTPWKSILRSLPFWSIIIAMIAQTWGDTTVMTEMPSYFHNIMKFSIASNGMMSALPSVTTLMLAFPIGYIADALLIRGYLNRQATRKLFSSISLIGPAIALAALCVIPDYARILTLSMFILSLGSTTACFAGYMPNMTDLSPEFSGILMGIANGIGTFAAILAPIFAHIIISDETDKSQWRIVFLLSSAIYLASNIFYVAFASGEVQPWNYSSNKKDREEIIEMTDKK